MESRPGRPVKKHITYTQDVQRIGQLRQALDLDDELPHGEACARLCDYLIALLLASPEQAQRLLPMYAQEFSDKHGDQERA